MFGFKEGSARFSRRERERVVACIQYILYSVCACPYFSLGEIDE